MLELRSCTVSFQLVTSEGDSLHFPSQALHTHLSLHTHLGLHTHLFLSSLYSLCYFGALVSWETFASVCIYPYPFLSSESKVYEVHGGGRAGIAVVMEIASPKIFK